MFEANFMKALGGYWLDPRLLMTLRLTQTIPDIHASLCLWCATTGYFLLKSRLPISKCRYFLLFPGK
jgi:hypothetical protein